VVSTQERLDQNEVNVLSEKETRFLRPHNYPPGTPDRPAVAVLNLQDLQGRTFMPVLENPFLIGRAEVERLRQVTKVIVVDKQLAYCFFSVAFDFFHCSRKTITFAGS